MGLESGSSGAKLVCRDLWKVYGAEPTRFFGGSTPPAPPAARADRIREAGHIVAAANVSFEVSAGEIFVIMGLSGSGKSTVVRCLSRLIEPTAGEVLLDGRDLLKASTRELIDIRRHKMGMVFQNFGLLPHLTVLENVAFPLKTQGVAAAERTARAQDMIVLVGLEGREHAFPAELSGGQQQRVGIARSLAVEPDVWFLDEPFSALDPLIRRQMQDEFLRLQTQLHKTIVFITHDFLEAIRLADRIAIMKDGFIVQIGTPQEIVTAPATDYVAEFTADAPVAKVLTARDVMEAAGSAGGSESIAGDTLLESILPRFADGLPGLDVTEGGEITGRVTAASIVASLARAARQESPE